MRVETDLKISKETAKDFAMLIYDEMAKFIISEKEIKLHQEKESK